MSELFAYDDKGPFLDKLRELIDGGVSPERITIVTPFHVHGTDELLKLSPSKLKYFTLLGALAGLLGGFALTIFTVLDWPLITGGKPLISLPAFIIIAFELTILVGAIASFIGFLVLGRFPSLKGIVDPVEHDNQFVVSLADEEQR